MQGDAATRAVPGVAVVQCLTAAAGAQQVGGHFRGPRPGPPRLGHGTCHQDLPVVRVVELWTKDTPHPCKAPGFSPVLACRSDGMAHSGQSRRSADSTQPAFAPEFTGRRPSGDARPAASSNVSCVGRPVDVVGEEYHVSSRAPKVSRRAAVFLVTGSVMVCGAATQPTGPRPDLGRMVPATPHWARRSGRRVARRRWVTCPSAPRSGRTGGRCWSATTGRFAV